MKQIILDNAIQLATKMHHGQFDMHGVPYILHPLQVMRNLNSNDQELNAIAMLHDILEDTEATVELLKYHGMTNRIINAVVVLTKAVDRKFTYAGYIERIIQNEDARLVKIADIEHNLSPDRIQTITEKDVFRYKKYSDSLIKLRKGVSK